MVKWLDRTPREVIAPLLRGREIRASRPLLEDIKPELGDFLGRFGRYQLTILQLAGVALRDAPRPEDAAQLVRVVRIVSQRFLGVETIAENRGFTLVEQMRPHTHSSARFARDARGADWYELLLTLYVATGLLNDFYVAFAAGLEDEPREEVLKVIRLESGHEVLSSLLRQAMDDNPRLASRLALWGRRLVGDTLLEMYAAMEGRDDQSESRGSDSEVARIEPAFASIVAEHTRRMDSLGLTS
ncbi:ferritin-like fold-containing protein [Humidisolicoccus flavus]|uniref:ferritin-like fold-containing protein n=1 Tax=Humidisolicoccus flavus TaxID=3111414 RepID=UPI0032439D04